MDINTSICIPRYLSAHPYLKLRSPVNKDESKAHSPLHTHVATVARRPDGGGAVWGQASDARTFIGLRREGLG